VGAFSVNLKCEVALCRLPLPAIQSLLIFMEGVGVGHNHSVLFFPTPPSYA